MRSETWLNDYVFTIENFFSAEECQKHIEISEDTGYEEALVNTAGGAVRLARYRNNDRVMFKNQEMADWIWQRVEDFVPHEFEGRRAIGVNELLRFYRYDPDQQFNWHQDHAYERDNGEKSCFSMLIYLNDGFKGGETSFDDSCSQESFDDFNVIPSAGLALLFEHPVHHKGEPVAEGRKYVLRTDVMYSSLDDQEQEPDQYEDEDDRWD